MSIPNMKELAVREIKDIAGFGPQDTLVIFGEFFKAGYVSGLIDEAQKRGMNIIYSTVGRRDLKGQLQTPQLEELYFPHPNLKPSILNPNAPKKAQPSRKTKCFFIDTPLEAGFDMETSDSGKCPLDLCQSIKLNEWEKASLDPGVLESSQKRAHRSFEQRVQEWLRQLEILIPPEGNILIAHTMAGGVPRAKIFMPILNRVLKGIGKRFFPSEVFWQTDLGKLCSANFNEVTAETFKILIDLSTPLREKLEKQGREIFYTAYSYHGTEVLNGEDYVWQTYSPYLQGFAKIKLENISKDFFAQNIKTGVFNVPEILTRSSSVFPGVEIPLYTLLGALKRDGGDKGSALANIALNKLKANALAFIQENTKQYFESSTIKANSQFEKWPQHNSLPQMEQMLELSKTLFHLHKEEAESITPFLSQVVIGSTGRLIFQEIAESSQPVYWLNHDIIARDISLNAGSL